MNTHTAEIDGEMVLATTVGGAALYRHSTGDGGYVTNERAICKCGLVCECAGDIRCNFCQEEARKGLNEQVRLDVAAGAAKRKVWKKFAGAVSKEDY